jgi:polar amino acid transport system permease protein
MAPSNASRTNGSADLAWLIVFFGAVAAVMLLLVVGPATATDSSGHAYNPFPEMLKRLGQGLAVTGKVLLLALAGSIVWGVFIGIGRVSHFAPYNLAASLYVELIRGIPLLVILFMTYYGLNKFLPTEWKLSAFWSAVAGLCVCYGAYIGEAVRAGIQAIPPEEIEAASLEADKLRVLWHVTLPRALRTILPAGGNECVALLKDTSLISILAISELTRAGQEYATAKFMYFETYTMVALIYLILTLMLSRAVRALEKSWMTTS